jgi:hypothetical protein
MVKMSVYSILNGDREKYYETQSQFLKWNTVQGLNPLTK